MLYAALYGSEDCFEETGHVGGCREEEGLGLFGQHGARVRPFMQMFKGEIEASLAHVAESRLEDAIYAEAEGACLHRIAEVIAAEAPGIALQAPLPGDPGRGWLFDLDPAFVAAWPEYHLRFEAATRVYDAVPLGGVATFGRDPTHGRIRRTDFYDDWMRPQGLGDCMLSVAWREGDSKGGAGWMRRRTQGEFGDEEVAFVQRLMPHFRPSASIGKSLGSSASAPWRASSSRPWPVA